MTELSEFEEMYLKRLFEAHVDNPSDIVKTTQLAEMMDVSPASTTAVSYTHLTLPTILLV